jgi:hypothetical protein
MLGWPRPAGPTERNGRARRYWRSHAMRDIVLIDDPQVISQVI